MHSYSMHNIVTFAFVCDKWMNVQQNVSVFFVAEHYCDVFLFFLRINNSSHEKRNGSLIVPQYQNEGP